ncbi:MAG: UrcA family protein [Sphingomonadaceae bacterium]|nr:UrcA family protein [Sphingomonadaceae bacterium]
MKRPLFAQAIVAAAIGSLALATPAAAGTMSVEHQDLDLSTAKGQKILQQRINQAAREVCGIDRSRTSSRIQSTEAKRCYAEAKAAANKQFAAVIEEQQLGG